MVELASSDLDVWKTAKVTQSYVGKDTLFRAEQTVLDLLRPRLGGFRMLDLGVGAGRTTGHFAPLVREYVGVDYAIEMIEHCRRRFPRVGRDAFREGDARQLDFPDGDFDFLLFSFNGIDSMGRADRALVYKEMTRVLRPGGLLCFSTHNSRTLHSMYSFHFPRDPRRLLWEYQRYRRLQIVNGPADNFDNKDWFIIKDGAHDFQTPVFYIRPEFQIAELEAMGYRDVKVFASRDGAQLSPDGLRRNTESWLHYLGELAPGAS